MDDRESFGEFVRARGPSLSRAAYLLTGDHAEAEDLIQETLIKTAQHWRRVNANGDPYAWVRRVMLNQLLSWRRRRRVRVVLCDVVPDQPQDSGLCDTAQTDDRLLLRTALAGLTPRQRAVLYLRYAEDRTEAATAAELGCSVGTVKRHAHDALSRLRTIAPTWRDDLLAGEVTDRLADERLVKPDDDVAARLP